MPPARGHVTHSEHGKCAWIVCKCCVADKHRLVTPTAHWESVLILWISRVTTKQMHSLCRGQVWIMNALSKYLWISEGRAEKLPASVSHPCMWVWADIRHKWSWWMSGLKQKHHLCLHVRLLFNCSGIQSGCHCWSHPFSWWDCFCC